MDLNELLQKTQSSGQPDIFNTILRAKLWQAREDYKIRHSRPNSQAEILKRYSAVRIADLEDPGPDVHLIRELINEKEPHYIYGSRGTLKSYNATMIALGIASTELTHVFGKEIEKHGPAIIFDSEMNERRYVQRIQALCRGLDIGVPYDLIYKNVVGIPPTESFPELHEMVHDLGAVVVVIDTFGFATRSKPEDYTDQRNDATEYIDPIIVRGATPIIVDHKPHQGEHIFGSVVKEFHGRGIFQVKDRDEKDNRTRGLRRTRIINEKLSHGPDGWGIDLETAFEMKDDEETGKPILWKVTMNATDVAGGGFIRGGKPDSKALVIKALEDGDKTAKEISEHSGVSVKTLEKVLPKMKGETIYVIGKEEGRGGASVYSLIPPPEKEEKDNPNEGDSRTLPSSMSKGERGEGTSHGSIRKPKSKAKGVASLLEHARTNRKLAETHNLIYRQKDVQGVLEWLKGHSRVALDTETYGKAKTASARKKMALSFVKGKIRLFQLSADDQTYLIDVMLLKPTAVMEILEALKGKVLEGHNLIFDLPRIKCHFGVDLLDEEIADTMVVSRLVHAGEWEENEEQDAVTIRHKLGEVLRHEGVADIPKEVDHKWDEPLTDERLTYATDDVRYISELHRRLIKLVKERSLETGYEIYMQVYREYIHMQYRGQPLDEQRMGEYIKRLQELVAESQARLGEHKPPHPEGSEAEWSWGNKQAFDPKKAQERFEAGEQKTLNCPGRNGARRALAETGVKLANLRKPTRISYTKKHPGKSLLLEALNDYYNYSDLLSDCQDWLTYYVEDGRIYANVNPFSQVTGRSAYSNPALQNSPKEPDPAIGMGVRDCIKPRRGHMIVKADYAAQELRILAEVVARHNGDRKLIEAFKGGDPHVLVGEKVAGHALDEERDPEEYARYRKLGKRANYGFSYGQGAERYQTSVFEDTFERIPLKQAEGERKAYRETWPGVLKWQKSFGDRSGKKEEDWYTTSFLGRRRYVGRSWDKHNKRWKPGYCDRLNGPIQAGGADMLYRAMEYLLDDKEKGLFEDVYIIITTHDEIVLEAPEERSEAAKEWLEGAMRRAAGDFLRPELSGPDCVEAETVPSWGGR